MISGARVNPVATDKLLVLSTGRRVLRAAAGSCFARTTRISSPPASGPPKRGEEDLRGPPRSRRRDVSGCGEDQGRDPAGGGDLLLAQPDPGASTARCCVRMGPPSRER
jgi:hypothetical protein